MKTSILREQIRNFVKRWTGKGYEKGETQAFWIELLQQVLCIDRPGDFISFELPVKRETTGFIDAYIDHTKVMIEQKSKEIDLRKPSKQSDGAMLTPFEQARRYASDLPVSKHPRYIVTSNFRSFLVYDMESPLAEPEEILLENLGKEAYRLRFLVETGEQRLQRELEVSIQAGNYVGQIYDAFLEQYGGELSAEESHALNVLCVRLVFCLYAEDAGIFSKDQFYHYLSSYRPEQMREALQTLFSVLDQPESDRDRFLPDILKAFPYVDGSLFARQKGEQIPQLTEQIADLLLNQASLGFDWSEISPTIFGAVFESTLNPETRRKGGMHYTSIENIHKVIDPLFMDDLHAEFQKICALKQPKLRNDRLRSFQQKLGSLKFLDPACGSGNFLTETYLSLRTLENEALKIRYNQGPILDVFDDSIYVHIDQFYGIEINDFASSVAKTALWIAESQMITQTSCILHRELDFLPLKTYPNITTANALRMDWRDLLDQNSQFDFIIGNPPFVGARWMEPRQKEDVLLTFGQDWQGVGDLDYVCCWYKKAAEIIKETTIHCAFVSTNSVTQGGSVANLWKPLFADGLSFDFAWRTFRWDSESTSKAHVHCVIIGFSYNESDKQKIIFDLNKDKNPIIVQHINGYLLDAPNVFIDKNLKPICDVPQICLGGQPIDDGNFILTNEEKDEYVVKEPQGEKFLRPFMMGKDFIDRKPRWCFWLMGANPTELRKCPDLMHRIEKVREFRLKSNRTSTLRAADTPTLFGAPFVSEGDYVAIPKVSSELRCYIPMDYLSKEIIPGDKLFVLQDALLYHFGVLTSAVHMGWMRAVCGRLKSDYSYSNTIVYNNFPWCHPTEEQKAKIEKTAQAILDARAKYPDSSLADLYDELLMPIELRKAHRENDQAVMQAYGFDLKMSESEIVAELFKMYEKLVQELPEKKASSKKRARKSESPAKTRSKAAGN